MRRRDRSKLAENIRKGGAGSLSGRVVTPRAFSRWVILSAATVLVLATVLAYSNSLRCDFVFDDGLDIASNASIRHLWPIWNVFVEQSDGQAAARSRPVVNLSLALNYAIADLNPFSYHLTNLLVHTLAGLVLFGIVRRTLLLPGLGERFTATATPLALATALIWILHPLQTEAVTYVVQRYESMMGLFYLLALYAAIRCGTSEHAGRWAIVAVAATLLALGCKEVAVSIPLIILLYDRAFLAGSFREAWRRRRGMYVGLAAAWAPFAALRVLSSGRGSWAGYGLPVTWIEYAQSEFGVILHYLRLTVWPCPLVLDYGWPVARTVGQIAPAAVVIVGLVAATGYALIHWPKWGFLGAWFFLILAPTSSVYPIRDLAFEHRMYLPLAAVVAGAVMGGCMVGRRLVADRRISQSALQVAGYALLLFVGVALAMLTFDRNEDYRDELSIWADTAAKAPLNERAHNNLGLALAECGRFDEATPHFQKALELKPDHADAHNNLGAALIRSGHVDEAIAEYRKALENKPDLDAAHHNLGIALAGRGQFDEAIAHYEKALEFKPQSAEVHNHFGQALAGLGQCDEAIAHYRKALEIKPDDVETLGNLSAALTKSGRVDEAMAAYEKTLEVKPNHAQAHNNYGVILGKDGRFDEAIVHFKRALELKPDYADARDNLGVIEAEREELVQGLAKRRQLLVSRPDDANLLNSIAWVLATVPNDSIRDGVKAIELARRAEKLTGGRHPAVLDALAAAYAEAGQFAEAVQTAQTALELAAEQNQNTMVELIQARLQLYRAGKPLRESKRSATTGSASSQRPSLQGAKDQ
jgi:protein O-mannosyl-transferase